jgi:hypothetical protein
MPTGPPSPPQTPASSSPSASVPAPTLPYSAGLLASVPRTISSERLITYLRPTSQDLPKALGLYEHNVHLSEALYGLLHSIEIATRNAMHYTLAANYGVPDWYDRAPLSPHWRGKVNEAKTASGVRATPGKVIAELTLGFWVDLVKHNNHRLLCGLGKN